jgi:hypothetical protein
MDRQTSLLSTKLLAVTPSLAPNNPILDFESKWGSQHTSLHHQGTPLLLLLLHHNAGTVLVLVTVVQLDTAALRSVVSVL